MQRAKGGREVEAEEDELDADVQPPPSLHLNVFLLEQIDDKSILTRSGQSKV